jgi:hypothetical protein
MAGMTTSKIVAVLVLAAAACASWSSAATAEETAKPARAGRVVTVAPVKITGRRQVPAVAIDIAPLTQSAPLATLKQPLADRIAGAVEKDPF